MKTNKIYGFFVIILAIFLSFGCTNNKTTQEEESAPKNWAEKLGYPAGKKIIILHADDAGMCEEANTATAHLLENDYIQSAAIMAPCPSADDFIQWAIDNPKEDIGMHLTLTSEWKEYRWGPITPADEVPGLIDPEGMLWHDVPQVVMSASAEEVEKEIRAQIDMAIAMGHQPTHIDTHMGTLYGHPSYVEVFFKVAEEYGIPANAIDLSDSVVVAKFIEQGYPIDENVIGIVGDYSLPKLDNFTSAPNAKTYEEKVENFKALITALPPGLTEIIFHPSVGSDNLKSITGSWQQRIWESEMFGDPDLIKFFEDEGIIFTNWIEIMDRYKKI